MRGSARSALAGVVALCASGCLTINGVSPEPVAAGQTLLLDVSNAFAAPLIEPGPTLSFDGLPMLVSASGPSQLSFQIPTAAPPGTYAVEIIDPPGLLEIVSIVLLLRSRRARVEIQVQ